MEFELGYLLYSVVIYLYIGVASGLEPIRQDDVEEVGAIYDDISLGSSSSSFSAPSYSSYSDNMVMYDESSNIMDGWSEHGDSTSPDGVNEQGTLKSLNRLSSFLYKTHPYRTNGFLRLDQNGDGYITKQEYSIRNPNMDEEIVRTLFDVLDTDGDDMLTQEELHKKTDFWETTEDCEVFAMQQCDGRLTYAVEFSENVSDQEAMCQGLQAYLDCLSSESGFCDFTEEFLQAVYTFANSYKTTKLCRELIVHRLAGFGNSDNSSRRKRTIDITADPPTDVPKLDCAIPQLARCSTLFNTSLREAGDFCLTLSEYRHCVSHAAKSCNDVTLLHLKESVRILAHMHKKFQVCDFH